MCSPGWETQGLTREPARGTDPGGCHIHENSCTFPQGCRRLAKPSLGIPRGHSLRQHTCWRLFSSQPFHGLVFPTVSSGQRFAWWSGHSCAVYWPSTISDMNSLWDGLKGFPVSSVTYTCPWASATPLACEMPFLPHFPKLVFLPGLNLISSLFDSLL